MVYSLVKRLFKKVTLHGKYKREKITHTDDGKELSYVDSILCTGVQAETTVIRSKCLRFYRNKHSPS